MAFRDYEAVASPLLVLPIKGKNYTLPEVGIADALKIKGIFAKDPDATLSDDEFKTILLGDAWDEMLADNVPDDAVTLATFTALADHQSGRETAETMWETGGLPERLASYLEAKTKPSPDSTRSPSSAPGGKTRSRASSSSTTSRKATPRKRSAKKAVPPSSGPR
jgi:hypothetical protein